VKTNCTFQFCREKEIEKTILRILGSSTFSHSLGQKAKYSLRAYVFRFTPEADIRRAGWDVRFVPAMNGSRHSPQLNRPRDPEATLRISSRIERVLPSPTSSAIRYRALPCKRWLVSRDARALCASSRITTPKDFLASAPRSPSSSPLTISPVETIPIRHGHLATKLGSPFCVSGRRSASSQHFFCVDHTAAGMPSLPPILPSTLG
jgi:hypothetical protein